LLKKVYNFCAKRYTIVIIEAGALLCLNRLFIKKENPMMDIKGRYSIRQVSERTGLSTNLIRKWEERYDLIEPERLDNGFRVYSEEDVKLIKKAKELVDHGYSVKNAMMAIAEYAEQEKKKIYTHNIEAMKEVEKAEYAEEHEIIEKLLAAGKTCDEEQILSILQVSYNRLGLIRFLDYIVSPYLYEIGKRWENGIWSEYQEHISSLTVRDYLLKLRGSFSPPKNAPLMLAACLPFERHEIPVHILLLKAMLVGWQTVYLGASPAPGAIQKLIVQLQPRKVVLSTSTSQPFEQQPTLLMELEQFASQHPHITFFAGGEGIKMFPDSAKLKHINISNKVNDVILPM